MSERILSIEEIRNMYNRPSVESPINPRKRGRDIREVKILTDLGTTVPYIFPIGVYFHSGDGACFVILPPQQIPPRDSTVRMATFKRPPFIKLRFEAH